MRIDPRRTWSSPSVVSLLLAALLPAIAQERIPAAGTAQIEALLQEKRTRTPAQLKLDSQLLYNSKVIKGLSRSFKPAGLQRSRDGLIHVDITAEVSPSLLIAITALGGRVESSLGQFKSIRAWLPLTAAETLAARSDVHFVRPAELRVTNFQARLRTELLRALPAFATEKTVRVGNSIPDPGPDVTGVKAHGADIVQAAGITGAGVKIGVLSDGVNSLSGEQSAGRLGPVTVLTGQGGSGDEGTAMLEIVYSMAPGAQLYFATADPTEAQFATNIAALRSAGCDIIVDDVTYFAEPVFQDGIVAQAVNAVAASGGLYFSSAGNSGNVDSGTAGTWEGDFNADGAAPAVTEPGTVHSFGATDYNVLTAKGFYYLLQWSDPFGGACNDYDLFILDPTGTTVEGASTNVQNCGQDPYEAVADSASILVGSRIVIVRTSGAARALHLDTERGQLMIATSGNTFGHNAGANTLTVAAVDASSAGGGIFTGGGANPPESFSSDGPRKIFYNASGNPITPGNLLFGTNGGTTLSKVDFTAADGVHTGVAGYSSFYGTSAAAPHAAAIAALVKSSNLSLTASQIKNILYSAALPVSHFQSRTVGSGILMANLAVVTFLPDLTISSTHTGAFSQGQSGATYTITVQNTGSGSTNGTVTVVDTLPAGLTATGLSGSGWVCTVATLSCTTSAAEGSGASFPAITLTVNVSASAPSSVINSVAVSGGGETNTSNDTANDPTNVAPVIASAPDLTVGSSHTGSFTQGQSNAIYTLTVKNSGTAATSGTVTITDALPASLTATAMSGSGWACNPLVLTCTTTATQSAGNVFPAITLSVSVSTTAPGSVINSVTVSGGGETNTSNDTANDSTTINPAAGTPDLTVVSSHGSFTQGQTGATYSLTVINSGAAATTATVTLVDSLPAALTATAMSGSGWVCNVLALSCTTTTIEPASTAFPIVTLTVNLSTTAPASVVNFTTVAGGGETNTSNDTANDPTTINPAAGTPDLTVSSAHGSFTQGQTGATYSIAVTNSGTAATSGTVTLVDTLPAGLTATAMSGSGWVCNVVAISCTTTTIEPASTAFPIITLTVNVSTTAPASVINFATVAGGGETNTSNDTANDPTTIAPAAGTPDLTIASAHAGSFTQGQTGAAYSIAVINSGTAATSGTVTVVNSLPAGLTATALSGSGWSCNVSALNCTTTTIEPASGVFPVITLVVNVAATAQASVTNSVSVSGGGETNTSNDTANDPTVINPASGAPSLTVASSHIGVFTQGQTGATYSVTVTNSGAAATNGTVTFIDTLPAGLTATSIKGSGWACFSPPTLRCMANSSAAAGSSFAPITLTVDVAANAPATVTNAVSVSGGGESDTTNNSSTDPTAIMPTVIAGPPADALQVRYAAALSAGDASVAITNTGASAGNICANIYTFDPAEELISCCTCNVTPNGLQSLSVLRSLIINPVTPSIPTAVLIKLVSSTGTCNAAVVSANSLAPGMLAWGTSLHVLPTSPVSYGVSETAFSMTPLSAAELTHLTSTCGFIQSTGSGFGICKGCATGGQASTTQ